MITYSPKEKVRQLRMDKTDLGVNIKITSVFFINVDLQYTH